jgi:hypothetical protein
MEISTNMLNNQVMDGSGKIKTDFTQKISQDEVSEIKEQITKRANDMMLNSISVQAGVSDSANDFAIEYENFQNFLSDIGYDGKPIAELSQEEAAELVSEDGIFGITQTSERIANFVINGAGGDEKLMRAGREGMIQGFREAEEMWGGELPEISQKTMQKAIELVDKAMHDLGFSILDEEV